MKTNATPIMKTNPPTFVSGLKSQVSGFSSSLFLAVVCLLAMVSAQSAWAASSNWTGAASQNWSAATWSAGAPSGNGSVLTLVPGASNLTLTLDTAGVTLGSIIYNAGGNNRNSVTIGVSGGNVITMNGTGATDVFGNLNEAAIASQQNNNANFLTVSPNLLMGTNLAVGSGIASNSVNINGNIDNATSGALTLYLRENTGGITTINGQIGDTTANGTGKIDINNASTGGAAVLNGALGASVNSVTQASAQALTLNGTNGSFTGNVNLNGAGTLKINNAAALGTGGTFNVGNSTGSTAVTFDNTTAAAITLSTNNVQNWYQDFTFTGTQNLNLGTGAVTLVTNGTTGTHQVTVTANTLTVGGAIGDGSNGYGLTKAGNGTLVLSGANTYTGVNTVNGGTLQFAKQTSLYNNTPASWTAANLRAASGATLAFNVGGTGEFTTANITTLLTNLGGLGGAVSSNGLQAGSSIGFDTTNASGSTFTVSDNIANSTGTGGGAIGVTKLGTNTLVLSGNNTYSGATTVGAGTLAFTIAGNANTANSLGESSNVASNLLLGNGTTLSYTGGGGSTDRLFTINGTAAAQGATIDASGTGAINFTNTGSIAYGTTAQTRTLTLQGTNTGNNTLSAVIGNNGGSATNVIKLGGGTWVLNGNNTFTGGVKVSQNAASTPGTLVVTNTNALGTGTIQLGNGVISTTDLGYLTIKTGAALGSSNALTVDHGAAQQGVGQDIVTFDAPNSGTAGYTQNFGVLTMGQSGNLLINQTANLSTPVTLNFTSMTGNSANGGWGWTLINNGVTVNITGGLTMAGGNNFPFTFGGSGNGSITGNITGQAATTAYNFSKVGTGTWTLSGNNTYNKLATVVNGGTLVLDYTTNNNSKIVTTSALTLNGGTVQIKGGSFAQSVSSTTLGTVVGQNAITQNGGSSTIALGNITFTNGAIDFASGVATTTTANNTTGILSARATVGGTDWATSGASGTNPITAYAGYNSTFPPSSSSNTTNYALAGNGSVTTSETVNTLKITTTGAGQSLALSSNQNLTLGGNGLLFAGSNDYSITTAGTGKINVTTGNIILQDWGTGVLTMGALGNSTDKYGTGKVILGAASQAASAVSVYAGTLQYSADSQLSNNATTGMNLSGSYGTGAALIANTAGSITTNRTIALGVQGGNYLDIVGGGNVIFSGVISGTIAYTGGTILNLGGASAVDSTNNAATSGTIILSGNNTYTGATALKGGTVQAAHANALGNTSGSIVFGNGTLQFTSASAANDYSARIRNSTGAIALDTNGQNVTFANAIDNTNIGGLTKSGAGNLTLSGPNTYTGNTTVNTGTLQLDGSTASASTVAIGTSGTLTGTGTVNGNTTLTGGGIINKSSGTIAGTLGVTGGNWNGAGTVTGTVTSSSGTFTIGNGANLTANGGLAVTGSGSIAGSSTSTITGSVNYTSGSNSTYAGVIAGSGKTVTMNATGSVLALSGANTYDGGTTVTAGTLLVSNASGSGLGTGNAIVNGGTLGGSGNFTGTVTVNSGGTLAPGASIGALKSGAVTFNTGSTFGYVVDSSALPSVGADLQVASGNLNLNGTVTLTLSNLNAGTFANSQKFTLINYSGTWNSGLFTYNSSSLANGSTFTFNSQTWQIDYNATVGGSNFTGDQIGGNFVNITVVPEPATWALLAFSLTTVVVLRRRRQS